MTQNNIKRLRIWSKCI